MPSAEHQGVGLRVLSVSVFVRRASCLRTCASSLVSPSCLQTLAFLDTLATLATVTALATVVFDVWFFWPPVQVPFESRLVRLDLKSVDLLLEAHDLRHFTDVDLLGLHVV